MAKGLTIFGVPASELRRWLPLWLHVLPDAQLEQAAVEVVGVLLSHLESGAPLSPAAERLRDGLKEFRSLARTAPAEA
ncbi:MAG TPA: hypothetical protein VJS92_17585 [Candidatus Polarisedimenticolaceae bacterium]|nr:hypothetical protein [Candidatus Polarisedimenticolaceae bacterium]